VRHVLACGAKISTTKEKINKRKGSSLSLNSAESEPQVSEMEAPLRTTGREEDTLPLLPSQKRDRQK
jgi:hypothetical protein